MTDEAPKTATDATATSVATTEPSPPPSACPGPLISKPGQTLDVPVTSPLSPDFGLAKSPEAIVRGGTTSGAWDKEMKMRLSDAETRRAQDAAERQLGTIPVEQGGAMNFERKFADPLEHPRVLLAYVGFGKEIRHEQLCEMVFDDTQTPPCHILIFVCPECHERGTPAQLCQLHVRDNHRSWHVDKRGAGEVKAVKNSAVAGGVEFYRFAGFIMDTDILRCDNVNCGAGFKISKNRLYRVR